MTSTLRRRLAEWEPDYWKQSAAANVIHPGWLGYLISAQSHDVLVCEDQGRVCAVGVINPVRHGWRFFDDVALGDPSLWSTAGRELLDAAAAYAPVFTCCPTAAISRANAFAGNGWIHVSDYRRIELNALDPQALDPHAESLGYRGNGPPRTWPVDFAEWVVPDAGRASLSPSLPAPPIYEAAGTTAVIDQVAGAHRATVLHNVLTEAQRRGDWQAIVVVATDDDELRAWCDQLQATHPVQVYARPVPT